MGDVGGLGVSRLPAYPGAPRVEPVLVPVDDSEFPERQIHGKFHHLHPHVYGGWLQSSLSKSQDGGIREEEEVGEEEEEVESACSDEEKSDASRSARDGVRSPAERTKL